ncbi:MAG: 2-iminoacetate synthase ThiH [Deltaproteobacteria bacterium]|nr:2-iminoacetate synthase ThiH [Deltaproteobacteria bacterium]
MSFASVLAASDLPGLRARLERVRRGEVEAVLGRGAASFADFLALLSPAASPLLEEMARIAHRLTVQRFGRTILLYAPLYLSSHCINGCPYCGYGAGRIVPRARLSAEQLEAEAVHLRRLGLRHVLLVAGEAPALLPFSAIEDAACRVARLFSAVAVEVAPQDVAGYARLAAAGVDGVTLYQESYLPDVYAAVHPTGPKRGFARRLEAIELAGAAGMRRLTIGALLGLADLRSEAIALGLHAGYLMRRFWQAQLLVSLPRLRHVPEGFTIPAPVGDRDLVQLLLALRIGFPDLGLVLSTREPAALRDRLVPLGITQLSAGSRTSPGGYTAVAAAAEQFGTEDRRSPAEVAEAVRGLGYDAVWKDWDDGLRQAGVR